MAVVAASVHGTGVNGSKAFDVGAVIGVSTFGDVVTVHIEANGKEGAFAAKVHVSPETGHAAGHLFNQSGIGTLTHSASHVLFEHFFRRHTHHRITINGVSAHRDLVAQRLHFLDCH